jgi:hypothetical protein
VESLVLDRGAHLERAVTASSVVEDLEVSKIAFASSTRVFQRRLDHQSPANYEQHSAA